MPSGFAVVLGGVCLEIQNRSRLTLCDFGQKGRGGPFGPFGLKRQFKLTLNLVFPRDETLMPSPRKSHFSLFPAA